MIGTFTSLKSDGFCVIPNAVLPCAVTRARRSLLLAIRRHGLTAEEIAACQTATFFPHLRWETFIWDLLPTEAAFLLDWEFGDVWCEPQIILRLPDEDTPWPTTYHTDTEPDWADGRRYKGIVGVSLTDTDLGDGGTVVLPGSHRGDPQEPVEVTARAGDALVFDPRLEHSGSLNHGSGIRLAVFFRLLGQEVNS